MQPPQIAQPEHSQPPSSSPQAANEKVPMKPQKPLRNWKYGFLYLLFLIPLIATEIGFLKAISWTQTVNDSTPVAQRGEGVGWVWLGLGPAFGVLLVFSEVMLLVGVILFSRFVAKRKGWRWGLLTLLLLVLGSGVSLL